MSEPQDQPSFHLHRRQFLAAGSAAAIGLAVVDLSAAAPTPAAPFAVAVGLIDEKTGRVAPVRRSRSAAKEARVALEGVWRRDPSAHASMALEVHYPIGGAKETAPVIAATYARNRGGEFHPATSPCSVPLTGDGLQLAVASGKYSSRVSMLQPGRYVIALLPAKEEPRWSSMRFDAAANRQGGVGPLHTRTMFGDGLAPFDYMIVRVTMV